MATPFDTSFNNGDVIQPAHVKQYAAPINALETAIESKGQSNGLASLDGTGKVPASQLPAAGATNLDALTDVAITSPASGQVIKHNGTEFVNSALAAADVPNLDAAKITSGTLPVARGGTGATTAAAARTALGAAAASHTHPISDVTNLQTSLDAKQSTSEKGANNGYASLDGTGKVPASQLPATGATNLDALTDVAITSPTSGQVIKHNGTQFVNSALSASDISSGTLPVANGGTGASTAANARTNLDVPSNAALTSGLAGKQDTSGKNAANGYAGLDASSKLASSQMSEVMPMTGLSDVMITSPSAGQTVRHNGTSFVNAALTPSDVGAAPASHTHVISDVTNLQTSLDAKQATAQKNAANGYAGLDAGSKLASSQMSEVMPMTGLSDVTITSPSAGQTVRYNGTSFVNAALTPSDVGAAPATHTHAAGDIASGELGVVRGGTGASNAAGARTNLDVPSNAELTSGLAAKQDVSEKNAANGYAGLNGSSKLASSQMSEVMPLDGLSDVAISSPATGQTVRYNGTGFVNAALTPSDVGAAPASHTHAAGDITSGTLPVARGGTGLSSVAANRILGTGSTANVAQAITVGTGLSLNAGTLSSNSPTGSGTATYLATWGSGTSLTGMSTPTRLWGPRNFGGAGAILYYNPGINANGGMHGHEVFYQYSRAAHKANITSISTTINDLMKWRAVEFDWKEEFGGAADFGLIAEEVAETYPRATIYDQAWIYTDEETGAFAKTEQGDPERVPGDLVPASVKYERAWLPMLAAVQDFYMKFQAEQAKSEQLEARLAELESALGS